MVDGLHLLSPFILQILQYFLFLFVSLFLSRFISLSLLLLIATSAAPCVLLPWTHIVVFQPASRALQRRHYAVAELKEDATQRNTKPTGLTNLASSLILRQPTSPLSDASQPRDRNKFSRSSYCLASHSLPLPLVKRELQRASSSILGPRPSQHVALWRRAHRQWPNPGLAAEPSRRSFRGRTCVWPQFLQPLRR